MAHGRYCVPYLLPSPSPGMSSFAELEVWQPTMMFLKEWPLDLCTDQWKEKLKYELVITQAYKHKVLSLINDWKEKLNFVLNDFSSYLFLLWCHHLFSIFFSKSSFQTLSDRKTNRFSDDPIQQRYLKFVKFWTLQCDCNTIKWTQTFGCFFRHLAVST